MEPRNGSRMRNRKTSEICAQCRNRKVRCDGDPRGCNNCKRLKFNCSLLVADPDNAVEVLERRRVSRACIPCRDRKLKCSGQRPTCSRCSDRGSRCHYPSAARASNHDSGPSPGGEHSVAASSTPSAPESDRHESQQSQAQRQRSGQPSSDSMPTPLQTSQWDLGINKQTVKQHIDAYFDLIHPIPCYSFLHRATLLQSWSKNELNPCVLSAICGITSRFINPGSAEHRTMAKTWIEDAESHLLRRVAQPRLSDIEAWLLVTLDHYLSQRVSKMLVSMALTSRLAFILRLNHEDPRQKFLVQERRRRLMWAIYIMDSLYSSGKTEFTACTPETLHIRLPCAEKSFSMDASVMTVPLHSSAHEDASNIGLLGYCIRVLDIRNRVQRLTLTITNHREPIDQCLLAVESIENELRQFSASLPARYHWDPAAFSLRAFSPSRTPFLMLHAWWHQTHCDLFRFTIPGFREGLPTAEILQLSPEYTSACREKCLYHAISVSKMLEYPMGDIPQTELVARLTACAEALEEQAVILPTTAILKKGLCDLVNDAQRDRHGPYACPSIWEEEESESYNATGASRDISGSGAREVFSKHSVTETVQNLQFQPGEQEDADHGRSVQPAADMAFGNEPGSAPAANFMPMNISPLPEQGTQDQTEFGLYLGEAEPHLDSIFNFGLHGQYGSGQPDVFMDSFWPLADTDWTMPDVGSM
ncbi:transcriptional regulatory [Fusarium tjaetaba]|uniref:Transcriptional regulatory n=1 Tax=Fusarium tjaetaba TaxID=1567544 RepID=A0A8H5R653_9HYPO|nr:transcriptional regulatory [Fusarium tjaetaba]KAF5629800.1 transcriptional regulatory [Fusarium tjaetaba]